MQVCYSDYAPQNKYCRFWIKHSYAGVLCCGHNTHTPFKQMHTTTNVQLRMRLPPTGTRSLSETPQTKIHFQAPHPLIRSPFTVTPNRYKVPRKHFHESCLSNIDISDATSDHWQTKLVTLYVYSSGMGRNNTTKLYIHLYQMFILTILIHLHDPNYTF